MGVFTEVDNTQAMHRSGAVPCRITARLTRSAARKTESKAPRHCSSLVSSTEPAGGPPTLISAPSSRPKASSASAQADSAVLGSVRSAASATARSGPIRLTASASTLGSPRYQHHARAFGDELLCCRPAESAARGGDDECAVSQAKVHDQILTPSCWA